MFCMLEVSPERRDSSSATEGDEGIERYVRFAIMNQVSTNKLERWVGPNDKIELSTCVAVGEFKQQTDKIYELAQVAYLTPQNGNKDMATFERSSAFALIFSDISRVKYATWASS